MAPFEVDGSDFFNLSATVWNSCVRSRNEDCVDLNCILWSDLCRNPRSDWNWSVIGVLKM